VDQLETEGVMIRDLGVGCDDHILRGVETDELIVGDMATVDGVLEVRVEETIRGL